MCYVSAQMGMPNAVVMPIHAPITKVNKAERQGGKVILFGNNMAEAKRHAMTYAKEKKMVYVNG